MSSTPDYKSLRRRLPEALTEADSSGTGKGALTKQQQMSFHDLLGPPGGDYNADDPVQVQAFQGMVANNHEERSDKSNSFPIWDNTPRYAGPAITGKYRSETDPLPILTNDFKIDNRWYEMMITPAQIKEPVDGEMKDVFYYPGPSEEIIEIMLVKMAVDNLAVFPVANRKAYSYGVPFSISSLRQMLIEHNRTRSHKEIVRSLKILNRCNIEIRCKDDGGASGLMSSPILTTLTSYSEMGFERGDPSARWTATFNMMVSGDIHSGRMRQYSLSQLLYSRTKVGLCLSRLLITNPKNMSLDIPYRIKYSDFVRNTGELRNYKRKADAMRKLEKEARDLIDHGTISRVERHDISITRKNRIDDVELFLYPSEALLKEIKAGYLKTKIVEAHFERALRQLDDAKRRTEA